MKPLHLVVPLVIVLGSTFASAGPVDFASSQRGGAMILTVPAVVQPAPSKLSGISIRIYFFPRGPLDLVSLYWQDNSRSEYSFRVERCAGATCKNFVEIAKTAPNVVRYGTMYQYQPGKVYRFRVRANGPHGFSAYSNIVNVTLAR